MAFTAILPPGALTVVANTGDDFEHLGLAVSPDLDTLLYTLAGLDNPQTGWGRRDETWTFMAALEHLGGETWFRLGDGDLATHIERTRRLAAGESLSQITDDFRRRLGISARLMPMSDERVRTRLLTDEGWLDFQDYFVRRQCEPVGARDRLCRGATAHAHPAFSAALADRNLRAVVICPSNPFISIDPILSLPGVREALRASHAPVVAVSPIIGGKRRQGSDREDDGGTRPAGRQPPRWRGITAICSIIMSSTTPISRRCAGLDLPLTATRTLMETLADREALARTVLAPLAKAC